MSDTARTGRYSDGSAVVIHGIRNGFTYVTFQDGRNKGITCKVPSSWVDVDEDDVCAPCGEAHDGYCDTRVAEHEAITTCEVRPGDTLAAVVEHIESKHWGAFPKRGECARVNVAMCEHYDVAARVGNLLAWECALCGRLDPTDTHLDVTCGDGHHDAWAEVDGVLGWQCQRCGRLDDSDD